jgi:alanyl-tRNA synthetase
VLLGEHDGKVSLLAAASNDQVTNGFHSGKTVAELAGLLGGGGGGRPNLAQGQGRDASRIEAARERGAALLGLQ